MLNLELIEFAPRNARKETSVANLIRSIETRTFTF